MCVLAAQSPAHYPRGLIPSQGRIQDSKLGVAQMHWKNWIKKSGWRGWGVGVGVGLGGGGGIISIITNIITIIVYISITLFYYNIVYL